MIKKWLKRFLIELLKEDYEVQMQVTKIANPDLAYSIQKRGRPKPPSWWREKPSSDK